VSLELKLVAMSLETLVKLEPKAEPTFAFILRMAAASRETSAAFTIESQLRTMNSLSLWMFLDVKNIERKRRTCQEQGHLRERERLFMLEMWPTLRTLRKLFTSIL
jgi:hypothetical protein